MPDFPLPDRCTDGRTAVVDGGRVLRFAELRAEAAVLADALHRLGLPPNSRIAVLLPNSAESVAAFFAVAVSGHSYLPLNVALKPNELRALFARGDVRAVLCLRGAKPDCPDGVAVLAVDELLPVGQAASPEGVLEQRLHACGPDREFVCLSTSGSSGEPRLVARSAAAVEANTRHVAEALQVTPEDRFLAVVPFWHANGFSNCLLTPLSRGASVVTLSRFLPRQVLETVAAEQVTVVIASPFVFRAFAQVLAAAGELLAGLGGVRSWISSGAALPEELERALRGHGIPVRQLYGSSETGTLCLSDPGCAGPGDTEPGCVGRPLPGVELRLVDARGTPAQPGEAGEVQVRSPALFDGYVADASSRPSRTPDGYYAMGDIGRWNAAGELVLLGRSDAMINVSGVKVDPREVQAVLESMPAVEEALVHGRADATGLQQIRALVVARSELSSEEVLAYCRGRLAEYKLPRAIEFVERIPRDLMGKTARSKLEN